MYKLIFYVPPSYLEAVKKAVFSAGGGKIGPYSECCWQVLGQGQFLPKEGAEPWVGKVGALETVAEYRVEITVSQQALEGCLAALRLAHPYEHPAVDVIALENIEG